jgi:predicted dehydrogenase
VEKARELARSVGAPAATTLAAAAHFGRFDAVVAACTPCGHERVIRDAIEIGVPILTEKPPAASSASLHELARLARTAGVPVCVGMNYRHAPGFQALRARLFGKNQRVEYAHVMHLVPGGQITAWGLDPVRCLMLAQAIHPVDQALALIGAPETAEVAASRDRHGRIRATWTLRQRDRVATIHVGNAGPGFRNTVTACGSDGVVAELRNLDELSVIEGAGRREFREQSLRRTPFADVLDRLGFAASVAGFLAAHAGLDAPDDGTEPVQLEDLADCYDLLESAIAGCAESAEEA